MTLPLNKIHKDFKLNSFHFNSKELENAAYNFAKEGKPYEKSIGKFLIDWLDDNEYLYVNTSGSTGQPKSIKLMKRAMVNSAITTGIFFKLKPSDTALNCLPVNYIAGKMMLVRAMILGLEIDCIAPSSKPIINAKKHYDFCAMVPLQLNNSINAIKNIKTIIIGGSKVTSVLRNKIKNCTSLVFETYGMTETITHIAVRQLKSKSASEQTYFKTLPKIKLSQDDRQCLVIEAPLLSHKIIVTNDIVDLKSDTSFQLRGRFDTIINSGGVKLVPEQIEDKLQSIISQRFIVASEKDELLGEKLILIVENPTVSKTNILKAIKALKNLDKFEIPKKIYTLKHFLETNTGKLQRTEIIKAVIN